MELKTKIKVGDWCIDPLKREPAQVTDVFYNAGLGLWMFSTNNNRDVYVVADFRPCIEPVYEWQWYCVDPSSKVVTLTHSHYVSNGSLRYGVNWLRLEDSKRVKEKVNEIKT